MEEALIPLLILVFLAGPILAIVALVRIRHIERQGELIRSLVSRLYALEQRLASLEQRGSPEAPVIAQIEPPHVPPIPVVTPEAPPLHREASSPPPPPAKPAPSPGPTAGPAALAPPPLSQVLRDHESSSQDLETLIAGRWFNRIGIVAILFGVSYFLKLAFDNNWIGPSGRVAIGILLGAFMLPWSHWLLGRGYAYFSEGIAGLGEATLYVSVWAGCQYYKLYSQDVGFAAMIVITAVMAAIALGRSSQRIAVLSLVGGFLTPILVSTGKDQQVVLFTYLLILGAGMLVIGARRDWIALHPLSFVLTLIYFWGWYSEFYTRAHLERTVAYATLFYLLYAILPVLRAVRSGQIGQLDTFLILLNAFAYLSALYLLLWPDDRWPLTLFVLALSAAHLVVARLLPSPSGEQSPLPRLLFAGVSLTFATLAIPIRLDDKWITLSFSVEGAVLAWSGFRSAAYYLRQAGYLLLAIAAARVLVLPPPSGMFLWNQRFAAYFVLIACIAATLWSAREPSASLGGEERGELGILAVAINAFALMALSLELWDFFGAAETGREAYLAQHLSLSVLWAVYASLLILFGVQRRSALLRWQSLALFGLVVAKVFLYDLASLQRSYRILSFLVLGSLLLVVSFLYQRKFPRERSGA